MESCNCRGHQKDLPNILQQQKKPQKWGKNNVLGAHAGCTTDRLRVIHGLKVQKFGCKSTHGLYYWQVMYRMWVYYIESRVYQTRHATVQSATRVWVGKIPKEVKNCLRKVGEMFYQTNKVFLSGKKDLKPMQKTERNTKKPQTDKALPSGVASSVVKESFLWLGFKRPSTYWGWKVWEKRAPIPPA